MMYDGNRKRGACRMADAKTYERLFEPMQIRGVKLKNRLVKTPQDMNFADFVDGTVTQESVDFYWALAKGGVGGIIVEQTIVDELGYREGSLAVFHDKFIPGLARIAEAAHKHDCPIVLQINHLGPNAYFPPNGKHLDFEARVPSALTEQEMHKLFLGLPWKVRPLTVQEIKDIIVRYADAAVRAKKAEFDGIELHGDHYYLINSFLSRVYNHRDDEYGWNSLEDRARFVCEIMRLSRERVGEDFILGMKLKGAEFGDPLGTTVEEAQEFAKMIEAAGADYFNVTADGYNDYWRIATAEQVFYPEPPKPLLKELQAMTVAPGWAVAPLSEAIKKVVSVPVSAVGRLDAELGEKILEAGQADFILMGRRLLADPDYPNKIAAAREDDIRPCTACITCETRMAEYEGVACMVNASIGRGCESSFEPAVTPKNAVVVGGGPAGMEAARVMAMRGHSVTLFEKESRLGGLVNMAALVKGTEIFDFTDLVKYFEGQLKKLGVKVKLGEEFSPELADRLKPDVVVLATGGLPDTPDIPGIDGKNVLSGADLRERAKLALKLLGPKRLSQLTKMWLPVGKKVAVIGGGIQGCETAEFLAKRGRKVTIAEATDQVGMEIPMLQRILLLPWFAKKGVDVLTEVKYEEVTDKGLVVTDKDGRKRTIEAGTVLITIPLKPNSALYQSLLGKAPEVHAVGDCKEPHLIMDAIAAGFTAGRSV